MKHEFSRHIFEKVSNIKFHQNPSSGSGVVSNGRTDGRTDMRLIVAFRSLANAPKNLEHCGRHLCYCRRVACLKQLGKTSRIRRQPSSELGISLMSIRNAKRGPDIRPLIASCSFNKYTASYTSVHWLN
jgi:hypothetical protein